jgi:hypothetical protein
VARVDSLECCGLSVARRGHRYSKVSEQAYSSRPLDDKLLWKVCLWLGAARLWTFLHQRRQCSACSRRNMVAETRTISTLSCARGHLVFSSPMLRRCRGVFTMSLQFEDSTYQPLGMRECWQVVLKAQAAMLDRVHCVRHSPFAVRISTHWRHRRSASPSPCYAGCTSVARTPQTTLGSLLGGSSTK